MITSGTRLSISYPLRWNSSQLPQAAASEPAASETSPPKVKRVKTPQELARKAALEREDDLQRDWDAKVVTYAELLPKTQSPSSVSRKCVFLCV